MGVILETSERSFDSGGSTFGCAFVDEQDSDTTYLYYSGSEDKKWSHAAIGLAISYDGQQFKKLSKLNPIIDGKTDEFNSSESLTPAVVRLRNRYYMFFAASRSRSMFLAHRKRIAVAWADDPTGPWQTLGVIAKPEMYWEGWGIDLGPSVVKLNEGEVLLYYSNSSNKKPLDTILGPGYWYRSIGILRVKINSPKSVEALKYQGNPLNHLQGGRGSPSESLFCPGYLWLEGKHWLLPTMSAYSVGFPYRQYVGVAWNDDPYFGGSRIVSVIIDGHAEKESVLPGAVGELALDTPSPVLRGDKLYAYYSVMDRHDGIWKTALSIIDQESVGRLARTTGQLHP